MDKQMLIKTAQKMVQKGKGILAADESTGTAGKRLESIKVESTFETRNEYRDMLFTADGIERYISGVILFDETIRQKSTSIENKSFIDLFADKGIIPGIKVDTGAHNFSGFNGEKITEGLDGLRGRLEEYFEMGARFAKWRAVITIGNEVPSDACIYSNAHALARYASLCQESSIVPIVEPEVLMDGSHTIEQCFDVTSRTLDIVFNELSKLNVFLEGIVLKPNMVVSAIDCGHQATPDEVSQMTVDCLKSNVPSSVPGIAFLSGGQTSDLATEHLNLMNKNNSDSLPWNLTYSYGRALQADALTSWGGKNRKLGQESLLERARNNSLASTGDFS